MPVTIIALTSVRSGEEESLQRYLATVQPLMQSAGANILQWFEVVAPVAGEAAVQYVSVIEYPDEDAVRAVFDSEAYRSLDEVKKRTFSTYQIGYASRLQ